VSIVNPAHEAFPVDDRLSRHAPEFEELDLLSVRLQHLMLWVSNSDKGQFVIAEVVFKRLWAVRSYDNDLGVVIDEGLVILAQLRHMPAAEGSLETAVKHQQDLFASLERGKLKSVSPVVLHVDFGSRGAQLNAVGHLPKPFWYGSAAKFIASVDCNGILSF